MRQILPRRPRSLLSPLAIALVGAAVGHVVPAAAQYYPYPAPYGPPVYMERPPMMAPRYEMLPPGEIRRIARGLGYVRIGQPMLSGRTYFVDATDDEGRVTLRVDAFTGRVREASPVYGGPGYAGPPENVPPPPRNVPTPSKPRVAARPPVSVPLPPPRPAEIDAAIAATAPNQDAGAAVPASGPSGAAAMPADQVAKAEPTVPAVAGVPTPAVNGDTAKTGPSGTGVPSPGVPLPGVPLPGTPEPPRGDMAKAEPAQPPATPAPSGDVQAPVVPPAAPRATDSKPAAAPAAPQSASVSPTGVPFVPRPVSAGSATPADGAPAGTASVLSRQPGGAN